MYLLDNGIDHLQCYIAKKFEVIAQKSLFQATNFSLPVQRGYRKGALIQIAIISM